MIFMQRAAELANTKTFDRLHAGSVKYHQSASLNAMKTPGKAAKCKICGKPNHTKDKCYFKGKKCNICDQEGHFAKNCKREQYKDSGVREIEKEVGVSSNKSFGSKFNNKKNDAYYNNLELTT